MLTELLKKYWGYESFREPQEDIVQSVVDGNNVLALLPTGGGKSLCFQLPALAMDGTCIVISPLIALMKDQVEQLKKLNIPAGALYSGMHKRDISITLENCLQGYLKILYVSPERLQSEFFLRYVQNFRVSFVAVDEAHCISQWGYDFRPSYLEIASFLELLPSVPVIALTATATSKVQDDIIDKLALTNCKRFKNSFSRPNISFSCFNPDDKEGKIVEILNKVPGAAIVYVRNRKKAKELALLLNRKGISAGYYHAGLPVNEREGIQDRWLKDRFRVMVATNAFGMGINKPDVRVVVHYGPPEDPESYYQEAGRAGRDGRKSYAVLLYYQQEVQGLLDRIYQKFPPTDLIKRVYQSLGNFYRLAVGSGKDELFEFSFEEFVRIYKYPATETYHALKQLEKSGFIEFNESFYTPSRLHLTISEADLYKFRVENPQFDLMLKSMLRLYGGELFSGFTVVSETDIGKLSNLGEPMVKERLQFLHKTNVLIYQPVKDKPHILFTEARADMKGLALNIKEIEARKENELAKARAMQGYMTEMLVCRQQFILDYFDEEFEVGCGICDNCLQRKKSELAESEELKNELLKRLEQGSSSVKDLKQDYKTYSNDTIIASLRVLADAGQVYIKDNIVYHENDKPD
ncbi:ATP-dependent DNA helicase RecQ [Cytophagaceae bacterium ABcell3]|nr:ATP-dependent DNA helicase RecQ [Cytophagaceae bacterium ABcell3]